MIAQNEQSALPPPAIPNHAVNTEALRGHEEVVLSTADEVSHVSRKAECQSAARVRPRQGGASLDPPGSYASAMGTTRME